MTYRRRQEICAPDIPLRSISHLYYVHNNTPYPVATSPTSIFKSAISESHPGRFKEDRIEALIGQEDLDILARWFLLNELIAMRKPMKLYSRVEAEKSIFVSAIPYWSV